MFKFFCFGLAVILFSCSNSQNSSANDYNSILTHEDSVKLSIYLDSIDNSDLLSMKRQCYLDSALTIQPYNAYFWQQKAMPLFKLRKYEIGLPYLDNAVAIDSQYIAYRAFMKCIFMKSYKDALKDFDLAIELNGNSFIMDHSYEFYKGLCYLQLNQFDEAAHYIRKGLDSNHTHFLHYFYMAVIYYELENYADAIIFLDKCLNDYPQFPDALFYKSLCVEKIEGRVAMIPILEQAIFYYKKGYSMNEDNAIYEPYPYQVNLYRLESTLRFYKSE